MVEQNRVQRSIAEHILWCREERERLATELAQFEAGTRSIGARGPGEPVTQGSLTRIAFLRRAIEELDAVIRAFAG